MGARLSWVDDVGRAQADVWGGNAGCEWLVDWFWLATAAFVAVSHVVVVVVSHPSPPRATRDGPKAARAVRGVWVGPVRQHLVVW